MREIQCSNVSVSLKTAITVHSRWVKWSWNSRGCMNNSIRCVAPCMQCVDRAQDVRGVGHLQACPELRSDSGIYWSCPETLWSVLIGAWTYKTPLCPLEGLTQPNMRTPPLPGEGPENRPCCCSQHHRARTECAGVSSGTSWGGQISCQLKQKLLKMVKQS